MSLLHSNKLSWCCSISRDASLKPRWTFPSDEVCKPSSEERLTWARKESFFKNISATGDPSTLLWSPGWTFPSDAISKASSEERLTWARKESFSKHFSYRRPLDASLKPRWTFPSDDGVNSSSEERYTWAKEDKFVVSAVTNRWNHIVRFGRVLDLVMVKWNHALHTHSPSLRYTLHTETTEKNHFQNISAAWSPGEPFPVMLRVIHRPKKGSAGLSVMSIFMHCSNLYKNRRIRSFPIVRLDWQLCTRVPSSHICLR